MSEPLASYAFLPWLRRGLASEIDRPDGSLAGEARAKVPVTLVLDAAGERREIPVPLALHGPGEVGSLDPRVVIRTVPKPGEIDAEPSYFAAIEFDQADFPWRYTSAKADANLRLRPWLVLIVVRESEVSEESPPSPGRLGAVTIPASALPRLSQSWAWAHSQVEAFDPASETVEAIIRDDPRRARSRLLCPRRLDPNAAYRALLVPAFERGRRAGLGETLDNVLDALAPAWSDGAANVRLPVYYEWRFQTGVKGDFETLARRLVARAVDDSVGRLDMDVQHPDPALPPASPGPLAYEGALVSPKMTGTAWPDQDRTPFVTALAGLLNRAADNLEATGGEATVAPPLWGRWHAALDRLDTGPSAQPSWFNQLNSDPRHRVAAGLGAEIVRRQDQQLMAAAWDQVESINEANAELRRAQLAREAAAKLHAKHYGAFDPDSFLAVTAPLHARFTASPVTVREALRRSPIPAGALEGSLRRVLRPQGAIARRARRFAREEKPTLFQRLNSGALRARPGIATPVGMLSPDRVGSPTGAKLAVPAWAIPALMAAAALFLVLAGVLLVTTGSMLWMAAAVAAVGTFAAARRLRLARQREADRLAVALGNLSREVVERAAPPPRFVPAVSGSATGDRPSALAEPGSTKAASAAAAFRGALSELAGELDVPRREGQLLEPVDLGELQRNLFKKMNPRTTITNAIRNRLEVADWVNWTPADALEPIMVSPEFDTPMYEPLRDHGQVWIMPGIGSIPPDTITLVKSNQRFIEAYMAGLSHEMGRELLYHEFPTDQRGTYFRQFWDPSGAVAPEGGAPDPDTLKDIKRIHEWQAGGELGRNSGRNPALKPDNLVFLVKGELLRRYPETLVYAVRTTIKDGDRTLGEEQKYPAFEGRLSPDIVFFGFDLVADDVEGHDDPAMDQGWYFLLQERPTEPIFGLDADDGRYGAHPTSWLDLNWAHLAEDASALQALSYIDLDSELPDTAGVTAAPGDPLLAWHASSGRGPAGANGSDIAHITLQRPFRVAIHGSDMLAGRGS